MTQLRYNRVLTKRWDDWNEGSGDGEAPYKPPRRSPVGEWPEILEDVEYVPMTSKLRAKANRTVAEERRRHEFVVDPAVKAQAQAAVRRHHAQHSRTTYYRQRDIEPPPVIVPTSFETTWRVTKPPVDILSLAVRIVEAMKSA